MISLGILSLRTGKLGQAETLLTNGLKTGSHASKERHTDRLIATIGIGALYLRQGKKAEAEELFIKLLEDSRRLVGEDHIETATAMIALGAFYEKEGKDEQAEPLVAKAVEISSRVLGDEHLDTLTGLRRLGMLYVRHGKVEQAESALLKAVEISRRALVKDESAHASAEWTLAGLWLYQRRKYADAEQLLREAANYYEKHPDDWQGYSVRGALGESFDWPTEVRRSRALAAVWF